MRNVLLYFAKKYHGEYLRILSAIKAKEPIPQEELQRVASGGFPSVTFVDPEYPPYFKYMYAPPLVLFYQGDLSLLKEGKRLAVIGSRHPTPYGTRATSWVLQGLFAEKDVTIVSGLARGIDALAHREALSHHQRTVAVLGCGIDVCYPSSSRELYREIQRSGLILSEYPEGVLPSREKFPMRNRIISALSDAILVTDAASKSGTQITVKYGLEMNRDIYAVPHPVWESSFCNELIRDGACPIFNGRELAEQIF